MNLGQAYQGWQQQSQNRKLYTNTKEAFRKAWFTLPTNKPCSYYTKEILGEALAETRVIESFKAKAASVMIHVLTFAAWAEPKFNPLPDFTVSDLMEYTKGPLADPEKIKPAAKREAEEMDDTDLDIDPITGETRKTKGQEPSDEGDPLEGIDFDEQEETKTEENMEEKKTRGRRSRKICQIDPETLEVVKVYDSCAEGCHATGAKNLDRAIKKLQLAAGYYWQYPEDVATFADRLAAKRAAKPQSKTAKPKPKVESDAEKQQAKVKNNFPTAVATLAPTPKPDDAPNVTNDNQRGTAAHEALEVFTDDELLEELDRRGWQGELRKVQIVTIGTK